ncbi:hypothetical protein GCM10009765_62330 [Fodinicola feengrottensis]|uniref:Transglycosylase SLT domain-containing protein n=2 Tax=Fodinicola feengrottensis TaxID=435914 RepID=A0ABN2IGQ2_9ACTN
MSLAAAAVGAALLAAPAAYGGTASNSSDLLAPGTHVPASVVTPKNCGSIPGNADDNVLRILRDVSNQRGVDGRVRLSVFETAWVESHANNLNCGTGDSIGVFQQIPRFWCPEDRNNCLDVAHAANKYLDQAIPNAANNPGWSAGRVAQSVQRSAFPDRYDQAQGTAQDLINRSNGL